jgi:HEAT repeat protein
MRVLLVLIIAVLFFGGCATIPPEAKVEITALRSSNPIERGYAAQRLGQNPELAIYAFDDLLELLDVVKRLQWHRGKLSPEPRSGSWSGTYPGPQPTTLRKIAIGTMVKIGEPAVEPLIEALRDDPRGTVRSGAAKALGVIGDERAVDSLVAALEDENALVRSEAGSALVTIDPDQGFYVQMAAMNDPSFNVRRQAVKELGKLGDPRAVPLIARATEDRSLSLPRPLAVRDALDALARIGDPGGIDPALAALEHRDRLVREDALKAARKIGLSTEHLDTVLQALKDSSGGVRKEAAIALAALQDPSTFEVLVLTLFDSEDKARYHAAEALGRIGNRLAIGPILDALPERNTIVEAKFYNVLKRLSGEDFGADLEKWKEWYRDNP